MSFLRLHRKIYFKPLNPKNDLTLWDKYTYHKADAPKASVQFSMEDVSFVTSNLQAPLNIPLQIPQRQTFQTGQRSVNFNPLKWMQTSECSFLECFFLGFIWGYFTFLHSLQCIPKYHFFGFTGTVFKHCLMSKEVNAIEWNTHLTKQFLRKILSSFYLRIFSFSP